MKRHVGDYWFIYLGAILTIAVIVLLSVSQSQVNDLAKRCHKRGGLYFATRGYRICLKKEVVISI